jgi:cysteine desulfurase
MNRQVYLDHHATTPMDPRVLDAMLPYFTEHFGNAASRSHAFGWQANSAVVAARAAIAKSIGAQSADEIVFTSGATECNNLAIKGALEYYSARGNHVITTAIEHKSVLDTVRRLATRGMQTTIIGVDSLGRVDPARIADALTPHTVLVSVMLANNEVGTIQPIAEIGSLLHSHGVLFHVDAAQGLGRVDFDVKEMNVDLASLSAHKIYGPKGCGALYVRRNRPRVRLSPQMDGGGHERGMRSGTLNVAGIVGFGRACELFRQEGTQEYRRLAQLRDRLQSKLQQALPRVSVNGNEANRLPGNLNMSFHHVEGEGLMLALKDIALSSGSACSSDELAPSYVLRAMGVDPAIAHCSIRFGIGRFNTEEEIDYVAERVISEVRRLRDLSPLWEMVEQGIDPAGITWVSE